MKIEAVDFFYLAMPEILDIGDGSQDALLVRVQAGGYTGWGECEAAPLVSIAAFVTPMSHSACKPVSASVLGQELNSVADIARIGHVVRTNSFDLLQADHTLSGIDMALWDLLGQKLNAPVYDLLGYPRAYPKTPYASQLFGDTPQITLEKARQTRQAGYRAAKFGWGPFGTGSIQDDIDHVQAAREGLGPDGILLIDAGTVWGADVDRAAQCLDVLRACQVTWLEEPFRSGALAAYNELAPLAKPVKLAAGEGAHNFDQACHLIDYGRIGYVQIDAGRIGGISIAKQVADYAAARGVTYVNHTFTSHLALSASLQPCAGLEDHRICEYPVELKSLAWDLTHEHLTPDADGLLRVPERPGLGMRPNLEALPPYLIDVRIEINGQLLYASPPLN
jgi:L-alanine-DL-glutamate epimerase-like enolase superfamily enzyme